jgi:uncharacterized oxidoreductase
MKTSGNTILITGGTSGIGHGLARRFHAAGNRVIVAGRRQDLLDQIVAENNGMDSVLLDVTDPDSIAATFSAVTDRYPELDVLINMAGVMQVENLLDPSSLAVSESIITTNLLGTIRMVSAFAPFLAAQENAVIMNVSSGLAFVPLPITPTYNATKAAVHSFTESLRVQLADSAVQVLELIPPAVQTTLLGQQDDVNAMPLEAYLTEVMMILATQPEATEVCVERVQPLRLAEARGNYGHMLTALSAH